MELAPNDWADGAGALQCVHFLHIGKTGGTAIKHALAEAISPPGLKLILHGHDISLDEIDPAEPVIFSLREPISRFVSAFYSRMRCGRPRYFFPWSELEQKVFSVFPTPEALALALADTGAVHHTLAREALEGIRHFRRLNRWLIGEDFLLSRRSQILFVAFQESLDRDFEILRRLLHLPSSVVLPTGELEAHRNPPGLSRQIAPPGVEALRHWYAEDIRLIEVCRQLMESRSYQAIL
jgi:hypothetical protein